MCFVDMWNAVLFLGRHRPPLSSIIIFLKGSGSHYDGECRRRKRLKEERRGRRERGEKKRKRRGLFFTPLTWVGQLCLLTRG